MLPNWLGREFLKKTLADLDNDSEIDVQKIRQLIDGEPEGSNSVLENDIA